MLSSTFDSYEPVFKLVTDFVERYFVAYNVKTGLEQ